MISQGPAFESDTSPFYIEILFPKQQDRFEDAYVYVIVSDNDVQALSDGW